MSDSEYIKVLKNGNFIVNFVPKILPLLFWTYLIYKFYFPYMKQETLYVKLMLFLAVSTPYIGWGGITIRGKNLFYPLNWSDCLTTKTKDNSVIAIYDYKCAQNQVKYLQGITSDMIRRFYYLNYAIFLFILLYQRIGRNKVYKLKDAQIMFILISIFLGVIGTLSIIIPFGIAGTAFNTWALMSTFTFGTILNMNIASFLVFLISLAN